MTIFSTESSPLIQKRTLAVVLWCTVCVCVCVFVLSHVWLFATPWTVAYQVPLSMGFSRQKYRSRLPFSSPGDLPNPGIEPASPALQLNSFLLSHVRIPARELVLKWKWKLLNPVWLFMTPRNSPGWNTGVGSHPLLQGIFPTLGSNPGLLDCRQILYCLNPQGIPYVLPSAFQF